MNDNQHFSPQVRIPQTHCRAAVARADITPPIGIYHRMWGAATHDRATGVHQPLWATLLRLEPLSGDTTQALLILALDHCILDQPDISMLQNAVATAARIQPHQVLVTLSHTHAAGLMSRSRSPLPGGELIGPYLDSIAITAAALAQQTNGQVRSATLVYGRGRSSLAAHRDFFDAERNAFVCGYNPTGPADDTLLVALIRDERDNPIAIVVNYACHPTTLAWQNTLISPDYVGALRETIELTFKAPCLFFQGASGDLGPRVGFVGNPAQAERNGRQLGYAVLAALSELPAPGMNFKYAGPVVSGATIGTWQYQPEDELSARQHTSWQVEQWTEPLHYRPDLTSIDETRSQRAQWQQQEAGALAAGNNDQASDFHARVEQATRQLWRLESLPAGTFPLPVTLARLGDALWLFVAGEHYQTLQTNLRNRFPDQPMFITSLTNGWQPGYIPPAETYHQGIYQAQIAVVDPGAAQQLLTSLQRAIERLTAPVPK